MTTIIIVVVVALVFFVALCVVTFMVWKREEEMRTDSLRSIEDNLQQLGYRMTGDFSRRHSRRRLAYDDYDSVPYREARTSSQDPFEWTRESEAEDAAGAGDPVEPAYADTSAEVQRRHVEQTELQAYEDAYAGEGTHTSEEPEIQDAPQAVQSREHEAPAEHEELREHGSRREHDGSGEAMETADAAADETPLHEDAQAPDGEPGEAETSVDSVEELLREVIGSDGEETPEELYEEPMDIDELENIDDLETFEAFADGLDVEELEDLEPLGDGPASSEVSGGTAQEATDGYVMDFAPEELQGPREPIGHDVGRSGRKYTAEELDMLIR